MAVNLYGVLYGMQAFVPRMIERDEEGLILNTTSVVGLTTGASSVYGVSKHAVTRLTEGLHYDLRAGGSKLQAALLVPGATATNVLYADRNRLHELLVPRDEEARAALIHRRQTRHERLQEIGMTPQQVAGPRLRSAAFARAGFIYWPRLSGPGGRYGCGWRGLCRAAGQAPRPRSKRLRAGRGVSHAQHSELRKSTVRSNAPASA